VSSSRSSSRSLAVINFCRMTYFASRMSDVRTDGSTRMLRTSTCSKVGHQYGTGFESETMLPFSREYVFSVLVPRSPPHFPIPCRTENTTSVCAGSAGLKPDFFTAHFSIFAAARAASAASCPAR
jgi:hypothetical protein